MLREKKKEILAIGSRKEKKGEICILEVLDLPVLVLETPPLPGGGSC